MQATATAKQVAFLKRMMLRNADYTMGGFKETLTPQAQQALDHYSTSKTLISQAISAMISAGFGDPKPARKTTRKTTARRYYCGGIGYNGKGDHWQNCNNPGCRG